MRDGHRVLLAGAGRSGELLRVEFPGLTFLTLPSPIIRWGEGRHSYVGLLFQFPGMVLSVFREHRFLKNLVHEHDIDVIISDNRYGLFCRTAYTVFVTHQLSPVLPGFFRWLEYPLYRMIRMIIGFYDECWIPDTADPLINLSGNLSHRYKLPANARFIGILSRFNRNEIVPESFQARQFDLVAVLSGPEPQISIFEELICSQIQNLTCTGIVVRGMRRAPDQLQDTVHPKYTLVSHLDSNNFARILIQADHVICRSGYSGIMDLIALGIQAIFVPTPGQTEQEYLASRLAEKGWFRVVPQHQLDLSRLEENSVNPSLPDLGQNREQSGLPHFHDLYGKYRSHNKKSHEKS